MMSERQMKATEDFVIQFNRLIRAIGLWMHWLELRGRRALEKPRDTAEYLSALPAVEEFRLLNFICNSKPPPDGDEIDEASLEALREQMQAIHGEVVQWRVWRRTHEVPLSTEEMILMSCHDAMIRAGNESERVRQEENAAHGGN